MIAHIVGSRYGHRRGSQNSPSTRRGTGTAECSHYMISRRKSVFRNIAQRSSSAFFHVFHHCLHLIQMSCENLQLKKKLCYGIALTDRLARGRSLVQSCSLRSNIRQYYPSCHKRTMMFDVSQSFALRTHETRNSPHRDLPLLPDHTL